MLEKLFEKYKELTGIDIKETEEYRINTIIGEMEREKFNNETQKMIELADKIIMMEIPEVIETEEVLESDVVELNLNKRHFDKKPQGKEIALIQKEIGSQKMKISVTDLIDEIRQGATFKAGALNGNKNIDWESQQVFAIDIDNDEDNVKKYGKMLTPELAYGRCTGLGIRPTFYYNSFSSTPDHPKFRLVFITQTKVTDIRVRNAIQMALMTIFPEADKACKDLSRIFFGSPNKVTVYNDSKDRLNPYVLIQSMVARIKKFDINNNAGRQIKDYCQSIGLNTINGLPDVQIKSDVSDVNALSSIIIYRGERENVKNNIVFNFNVEVESAKIITNKNDGKKKLAKININNNKIKFDNELIQHFSFDDLGNKCKLWSGFVSGTRWCYHDEIFGIATNMWRVKGAERKMIEAINNNKNYKDSYNKINTIKGCRSYGYAPKRCEDFCPYYNECHNCSINMLQAIDNKRGNIRLIKDAEYRDKEEIREEMASEFAAIFNELTENKINVIKAPTGIGKTEMLKDIEDYNGICIAVPTHKLAEEVYTRLDMCKNGGLLLNNIETEDEAINNEYKHYQAIGDYKRAYKILEDYANSVAQNNGNEYLKVLNYLTKQKECHVTTKPIVCTHSKMLHLDNKNIHTYIVDEDILLSVLFQTVNLSIDILDKLTAKAKIMDAKTLVSGFETLKQYVNESRERTACVIDIPPITYSDKDVKEFMEEYGETMDNINIKTLLAVRKIKTDIQGETLGAIKNDLPEGKIIILSATSNEVVYKGFIKNKEINFIDLGLAKSDGNIIHHNYGFSRSYLSKNANKAVDIIKEEAKGVKNIITFKKYEQHFKKAGLNTICNYGACTGIDAFGGQDLIVAGTPHINDSVYKLLASFIEPEAQIITDCEYSNVVRNGFEFYFNTFNNGQNNILQEIQFYMIESELVQAIGRARALNNNCTVHVFSNYPVAGATLYR